MAVGGRRRLAQRPGLDERTFAMRHRFALILLWAQVPFVALIGLLLGTSPFEVLAASMVIVGLGILGTFPKTRVGAGNTVSIGLITSAGILVYVSGGLIVANFYFLVMVVAISTYREWRLLGLAGVYVLVFQLGIAATPVPLADPAIDPFLWAVISSLAVLAAALLLLAGWRIDQRASELERADVERYRLAYEAAPPLALATPSGEIVEANTAMAVLLGYDRGELAQMDIRSLVHGDDLSELGSAWEEMGNGETHTTVAWMRCLTATGAIFWARMSLTLAPLSPNRPAMVVLELEDASRAHDTEMRLEGIIAGKDAFVAAIGDELRVPLGTVIDLTQIEGETDDALIRQIEAHAREISNVVDDLVVSARLDVGPVAVVPRFIDAAVICRDVLARLPGSHLVTQELRPLSAWADPQLAKQILNGLVGNALRFGGHNVVVRTVSSGPDTVIQVIDDGPEIPMRDRHRIFSSDLHSGSPVTQPASVGLGLTVGRRLARMMDGDIVYRRTNGHRNVFELRLPSDRLSRVERPLRPEDELEISA